MSVDAVAGPASVELDAAVAAVRAQRTIFARLAPTQKASLLRACISATVQCAEMWVIKACQFKQVEPTAAVAGEEWLSGPYTTVRYLRLLAESMAAVARDGRPPLGTRVRRTPSGRLEVILLPTSVLDRVMFWRFEGSAVLQAGLSPEEACERQASFYRQAQPVGAVCAVLGAGNVTSIPLMDVLGKLFVEGSVCVLKLHPLMAPMQSIVEHALAPLIRQGYVRVVAGDARAGAYLCNHPGVDSIHVTGSEQTYAAIVGARVAPVATRGPDAAQPPLAKLVTAELGNISPVVVAPARYARHELDYQARNLATMVVNNGSFNCNAARLLVTAAGWPQRDAFLVRLRAALQAVPARPAYYPGAREQYAALTRGRRIEILGDSSAAALPWTLVGGIDPRDEDEPLFATEPFCPILGHVELAADGPADFLDRAAAFCNDRLWGTLNATLVVPPSAMREPTLAAAVERAIDNLRYGTVAVNQWPAIAFASGSLPWGGHPSARPPAVQSGVGWVHNSSMLEGVEKSVLRGPITTPIIPPWFANNRHAARMARLLLAIESGRRTPERPNTVESLSVPGKGPPMW